MSVELAAALLGSPLVRAVASEIATTLASQAVQHVVKTAVSHRPGPLAALPDGDPRPHLRVLPTAEVLSSVPGRARLRVQGIRGDAARAESLADRARALPGVGRVEANPLLGTLLVRYEATGLGLGTIVEALEPPRSSAARTAHRGERTLRLVARESA